MPTWIKSESTTIDYLNFNPASTPNPSPLLLDIHNVIASLTRIVLGFQKPCRYAFPVKQSIWKLFVRNEEGQEDTNSRQSPHTRSPSYASRHSSHAEVQRRQSLPIIRGRRAAMTSWDTSSNTKVDAECTDSKFPKVGEAHGNFQGAIDEYLGLLKIDYRADLDVESEEDESSIRCNAFLPAWLEGVALSTAV
ncbi:hypothetical protein V8E54_007202 [Elaphomyces granulatus]|jgi:hypothetical protein